MPVIVQCAKCGKSKSVKPSQAKKHKRHFCSEQCKNSAHSEWMQNKPSRRVTVNCSYCGHPKKVFPSRLHNGDFFCNQTCRIRHTSQRTITTFHCQICGKEFTRSRSLVRLRGAGKYCSRPCQSKGFSKNRRRSNNPMWRGGHPNDYGPNWSDQRKKAYRRDREQCVLCKTMGHLWKLDVHHITPFREFNYVPDENFNYLLANSLDNLVTLCRKCHRKVERNPNLLSDFNPASAVPPTGRT